MLLRAELQHGAATMQLYMTPRTMKLPGEYMHKNWPPELAANPSYFLLLPEAAPMSFFDMLRVKPPM